jgi:hypothetical protein
MNLFFFKIIFVYCGWCRKFMWRVKLDRTTYGTSHGICRKCSDIQDALIEEL